MGTLRNGQRVRLFWSPKGGETWIVRENETKDGLPILVESETDGRLRRLDPDNLDPVDDGLVGKEWM